jgi:DNA-binding helix-hairpin-helix protein with protein kinase domain
VLDWVLTLVSAKADYDRLVAALMATSSDGEFQKVRSHLHDVRRKILGLPAKRAGEIAKLERDRRQVQLESFLERFRIARASISGIGPTRTATLESYGIETAADVKTFAITAVPGFGMKMAATLVNWRLELERTFVFDETKPIDQAHIARLDATLGREQADLIQKLRDGPARLAANVNGIARSRRDILNQIEAAARRLAQAQADA